MDFSSGWRPQVCVVLLTCCIHFSAMLIPGTLILVHALLNPLLHYMLIPYMLILCHTLLHAVLIPGMSSSRRDLDSPFAGDLISHFFFIELRLIIASVQ